MTGRPSPVAAFGIAALGIALFSLMDAMVKELSLAIGVYNTMFWRSLAGAAASALPYAFWHDGKPSRAAFRIHVMRGVVGVAVSFGFFWGIARVPLAQGIALSFIAPIFALILAALLLGERIGRSAVLATLLAFAGVLVILGGQAAAHLGPEALAGAIAILVSASAYAWNIILMRQQSQLAGPWESAFFQSLFVCIGYALASPFLAKLPELHHVPMILGAAVLQTGSLLLLSWAYAHAEASYLATVEYTAFIWAALFGWIFFSEHVSLLTVAGAAMIVVACIASARGRKEPPPHVETTSA